MKIALALVAGTLLAFGLSRFVAERYGSDVKSRFIERGAIYTADSLAKWVTSHSADAAGYACPTLFPVDLLFMAFLAGMLGFVSVRAAVSMPALAGAASWFVVLPSVYLGVDLAEDVVLATLLTLPTAINPTNVTILHALTRVKIWSVTAALLQAALLTLLAAKPYFAKSV
jgi:hypothetical protein